MVGTYTVTNRQAVLLPDKGRMTMTSKKCPDCGCTHFYVKDPDDQYNISEFELVEGEITYTGEEAEGGHLRIGDETETYCDKCAWHDQFKILKS